MAVWVHGQGIQLSIADPESGNMKHSDGGYHQSYNVQCAIDGKNGLVVGVNMTNEASDAHQLKPMVEQVKRRFGREARNRVNDSGYNNGVNLMEMEGRDTEWWCPSMRQVGKEREKGGDVGRSFDKSEFRYNEEGDYYECPGDRRLIRSCAQTKRGCRAIMYKSETCEGCEHKSACAPKSKTGRRLLRGSDEELIEKMDEKMSHKDGKLMMKKRRCKSEWVFAQIKSVMG